LTAILWCNTFASRPQRAGDLDSIESYGITFYKHHAKAAEKSWEQYDKTECWLNILRNTNLEELNPEGISQDLTKLLDDPKGELLALRDRLSQVDQETFGQTPLRQAKSKLIRRSIRYKKVFGHCQSAPPRSKPRSKNKFLIF